MSKTHYEVVKEALEKTIGASALNGSAMREALYEALIASEEALTSLPLMAGEIRNGALDEAEKVCKETYADSGYRAFLKQGTLACAEAVADLKTKPPGDTHEG